MSESTPITVAEGAGGAFLTALRTARLRLRPFVPADAEQFRHQAGVEELVKQTLNFRAPMDQAAALEWIADAAGDMALGTGYTFALERLGYSGLVGAVGLMRDSATADEAEIGYWIARIYWGSGFATEAVRRAITFGFADLGLDRVWACMFAENQASRRVLEKAGLRHTETRRENCPDRGGARDVAYFSRSVV